MNKKVCIKICGLHYADPSEEEDNIEVINIGTYGKRGGKHFVRYEEPVEYSDQVSVNLLKFNEQELELLSKGASGTHLIFTRGQKNLSYYDTPFGGMNMGIETYDLNVEESPLKISVDVAYGLEINLDYVSQCRLHIDIESIED